jgi:CheY-like chemotaxis protein
VELHGGRVRVKSGGKGNGSTFSVELPVTIVHPEPDELDSRPTSASKPTLSEDFRRRLEGARILVVDDEADARLIVQRVLEDNGATVLAAASADEAIELLERERSNLLISDIGMPRQDGYALIARVRELGRERGGHLPAIALTAYARPEDRMKAMVAGFDQHLVKPVEPLELLTLAAVMVSGNRSR